jgi:hypothetical protein
MSVESVRADHSPTRCPFCKGDLSDMKEIVACTACGARHHAACREENGRCATCGSTEVLVPRSGTPRSPMRAKLEQPPQGSKIVVSREGDALVYAWDTPESPLGCAIVCLFTVVLAPVALYFFIRYLQQQGEAPRRARVVLGPDTLEVSWTTQKTPVARIERAKIGGVRAVTSDAGTTVYVDEGIQRKALMGLSALTPVELEWLAAAIDAWRSEA